MYFRNVERRILILKGSAGQCLRVVLKGGHVRLALALCLHGRHPPEDFSLEVIGSVQFEVDVLANVPLRGRGVRVEGPDGGCAADIIVGALLLLGAVDRRNLDVLIPSCKAKLIKLPLTN